MSSTSAVPDPRGRHCDCPDPRCDGELSWGGMQLGNTRTYHLHCETCVITLHPNGLDEPETQVKKLEEMAEALGLGWPQLLVYEDSEVTQELLDAAFAEDTEAWDL